MSSLPKAELSETRKGRGAFFTPPEISRFMTEWALRSPQDIVLEPSCGEAAFLLPAARRLRSLGALELSMPEQLHGLDIHRDSVTEAGRLLACQGFNARLEVGDFFERRAQPSYDAVIGNPPYVRYQNFSGAPRVAALEAALRQGVRLNRLASSWAAFTVHASAFLRSDGRLALVLPAELLAVKYAAEIRRFLLHRFAHVRLVLFETLVFPGVLEEVVLLLAEGSGGAERFEVYQARDAKELRDAAAASWFGFAPREDESWTGALLPSQAYALYDETLAGQNFETLSDWGQTYLGAVTGNNNYFCLKRSQVDELGLADDELVRISPPGSRHLRGLVLSEADWMDLVRADERCYLFAPGSQPSRAAQRYIAEGESKGVHETYKCQVREPWWQVPLVRRPDLVFTYMNHDRPRLLRNAAGVQLLNSLYGVRLHDERRELGGALLAVASLNSMTLLGAEIVGRSYGGGMLKHEPSEADRLPLPSREVLESNAPDLLGLRPQIDSLLARNEVSAAVDRVDRLILREFMGMSNTKVVAIRAAREILQQRRMNRARGQRGKG